MITPICSTESDATLAERVRAISESEGWPTAAALIEREWDAHVTRDPEILLDAIKVLPAEALIEHDGLLVAVDYLRHLVSGGGPGRFRVSTTRGADRGDLANRLIVLTGRTAELRTAGSVLAAADAVREARELLADATDAQRTSARRTLPHVQYQWGVTLDLADDDTAAAQYDESYQVAIVTGQPAIARRAAGALAWLYASQGRTRAASLWIDRANATHEPDPRNDTPLRLAEAMRATDVLHPDPLHGLPVDADPGEYWLAALWTRAHSARTRASALLVEAALETELARHDERLVAVGANRRYLIAARMLLAAAHRRPFTPDNASGPYEEIFAAVTHYRSGDRRLLRESLRTLTSPEQHPRILAVALLLAAATDLDAESREAAADGFRQAHALIEHEELLLSYAVLTPAHLRELFALAGLEPAPRVHTRYFTADDDGEATRLARLSKRERQVLTLLASEHSMTEIADTLFVSLNTVKTTVRRLYAKLGVHDRRRATDIAHRAGLRTG
ncbi:LuxR C-terminal-related transcriptional regulator [Microbacterium sp. X-17]|uniref:helix-turn-helix transcriptional regulator n=1 Tax=Microbacterium sp. X-17 TaxID=3144404 RepID=UPI0031F49544